jgi:hypothetical protein
LVLALSIAAAFVIAGLFIPGLWSSAYYITGIFLGGLFGSTLAGTPEGGTALTAFFIGCAAIAVVKAVGHYSRAPQARAVPARSAREERTSSFSGDYFVDRANYFLEIYQQRVQEDPTDQVSSRGLQHAKRFLNLALQNPPASFPVNLLLSNLEGHEEADNTWRAMTTAVEALQKRVDSQTQKAG